MELGGICVKGARLLLSRNRGAMKTAYKIQLVAADEPECGASRPCWVGAHPLLGNRLAAAALARGLLAPILGAHSAVRAEAMHGHMRVDFELTHAAAAGASCGSSTLLEIKNVVCSDYLPSSDAPKAPKRYKLVYANVAPDGGVYSRSAVFPVGKRCQKLEDDTVVVSERAIKHLRELSQLKSSSTKTAVLFVVNRADCERVCLLNSSCAVFGREAQAAAAAGVALLAFLVRWVGGAAYFNGVIPVDAAAVS